MLLEDNTAFQPGFGRVVHQALNLSKAAASQQRNPNELLALASRPTWGRLHFGYGYSGIVLHISEAKLYQQMHYHFFDELPCDVMVIFQLLGDGNQTFVVNPTNFSNGKQSFLKHLGKVSTLSEKKTVKTW